MSQAPNFFKFHLGDYARDCEELSMLQHGAYLGLMRWYYSTASPLPNDLERIYRRMSAFSIEERNAVMYVLENFFRLSNNVWTHKRIDIEIGEWMCRSDLAKRSVAIRERNRLQNNEINTSNDHRTIIERSSNQNQNQNQKNKGSSSLDRSNSLEVSSSHSVGEVSPCPPLLAQARELLQFTNEKTGRNFRPTEVNLKFIEGRLREGYSVQECRAVVARKCREWGADDKMRQYLRPATLFNREKFSQYVGDVNVQVS